jgi:hypothetical protein
MVSICIGNPFDPAYRAAVEDFRAGRFSDRGALRRKDFGATRLSILDHGKVIARHYQRDHNQSITAKYENNAFSIGSDTVKLGRDRDGLWTLTFNAPTLHRAFKGFLRPRQTDGGCVTGSLSILPDERLMAMSRALLPDSPGGSNHDWLIAAPRMECSGEIVIQPRQGHARRILLRDAVGTIDSFRGGGPLGEGMRRFFISQTTWPGGTAIGELVVIRKYIQIAPTLLIFTADGQVNVMRCDRAPRTSFQRSKWLLGYPLALTWRHDGQRWHVEHALPGLNESIPCRSWSITKATLTGTVGPNSELVQAHSPGTIRLIQPSRIDSLLWRYWLNVS